METLNQQTEEKLGFDDIRELLAGRANTEAGKAICRRLRPMRKHRPLEAELARVVECRDLLQFDESFSLDFAGNIDPILAHAGVAGNWLNAQDCFSLLKWLRMVRGLLNYFRARKEKYPGLWGLVGRLDWNKGLIVQVERLLDDRGNIRDDASPKLKQLRKERQSSAAGLRRTLQAALRNAIANGWSEDGEITIRNDRLVIPMKADFKGRIKGFVHDVSQSGQTIYIEPSAALEANNKIRQLLAQEQNEITRMLMELTAAIRAELPALEQYATMVARMDFIRAKGRLAVDLDAVKPVFKADGTAMQLIKARHPLLTLKAGMRKEDVVPLSMRLDTDSRIVLVSGPNAGGKSVSLKTVGLLQVMLQCGLLVPVDEASEFRWFTRLFIDIGDEQSIQSDLSTYTSHLANMREMLDGLNDRSLFLMDEFGSGTDPRLGGAIAEAFLERFVASGAYGIITTHYGNLKNYADRTEGIVNAAMQFDPETLSPTYQIEVGVPGRSYAFEIARNVGISEELITAAREKIDSNEMYAEDLLLRLEAQKSELDGLLLDNRKLNNELHNLLERNQDREQQIRDNESRILEEAEEKAEGLISAANARIERTIREIKEAQAEKERTQELRRELKEMVQTPGKKKKGEREKEAPGKKKKKAEQREATIITTQPGHKIEEGDWVKMKDGNAYGKVLEIQGKRAIVALGEMRVTVKVKDLVRIKAPKAVAAGHAKGTVRVQKKAQVTTELRIQGFRVEAALPVVEKFIDDALLAGLQEVRILHGKGTGALRQAIRDFLRKLPDVLRSVDAPEDQGGSGWTLVSLKKQ